MATVEDVVRMGVERRASHLEELDRDVAGAQRRTLLDILRENADTEVGRRLGFGHMASVRAWQDSVPPSGPRDYLEAWEGMARGEAGVLVAEPVEAWGLTSGTTGTPKRLPITRSLMRGFRRALEYTVTSYLDRTEAWSLLDGYILRLAAPSASKRTRDGLPVGFVTGLLALQPPFPFHNAVLPTQDVTEIEPWPEKLRLIGERYAGHDVRLLMGCTSNCLSLLRNLKRDARRSTVDEIWPNLRLVVTSCVALEIHREAMESLCPGASFMELYFATEAPMAFQGDPDRQELTPLVEDSFFEFVREEESDDPDPRRFTLAEVEPGVRYTPLVTTRGGLYAYRLTDVVTFPSVSPPRMRLEGRLGSYLNLAAEKVSGAQAATALDNLGIPYAAFTGAPLGGGRLGHEWVVEFAADPPDDVAEQLDRQLRELNPDYATMRAGEGFLEPPVVTRVREGTFQRALDRRPGQAKILRAYSDRRAVEELVALHRDAGPPRQGSR